MDNSIMLTYRIVVETTAMTKTRNVFARLKLNSSEAWEIHSKPMNAHGEIQAIFRICEKTELSGM